MVLTLLVILHIRRKNEAKGIFLIYRLLFDDLWLQ